MLRTRLQQMEMFLWLYISSVPPRWMAASEQTALSWRRGKIAAGRSLREWTRAFIANRHDLPWNPYGGWTTSLLMKGDLAFKLSEHLLRIGKYVRALDIVEFLSEPEIQERYGLTKTVSLSTAQSWMHTMGYRWKREPNGQFVDGHERDDVVEYRQKKYIPAILKHRDKYKVFIDGNEDIPEPDELPSPSATRRVVVWYHDESTFYANDRRCVRWVHESEKAVPKPKSEGQSLMVADFVSAEYGWLQSKDGKESTRVLFRAGKGRDGYFSSEEILGHLALAAQLLRRDYPDEDHIIVLDNAPTHLKRAEDALSARRMSKGPTPDGNGLWGVMANVIENTKPIYDKRGKLVKEKKHMADAKFSDGTPQSLYFPDNHPEFSSRFKGMTNILVERGFNRAEIKNLRAECPKFQCPPCEDSKSRCCTRRLLYNQPDFLKVESLAETYCKSVGIELIFLPRFHCELNPIERCWSHAKREYRSYPPSKLDADLESNVIKALDSVPIESIRRYFVGVLRLLDGYNKGLKGAQALWAKRKYKSHRILPPTLFDDMKADGIC